jgi:hypothetical protein
MGIRPEMMRHYHMIESAKKGMPNTGVDQTDFLYSQFFLDATQIGVFPLLDLVLGYLSYFFFIAIFFLSIVEPLAKVIFANQRWLEKPKV